MGLIAGLWAAQGTGIISSNDGSHLALARALTLRQQSSIDPEAGLTLYVDVARRSGLHYSDRPPGTAFLAAPAVWLGRQIDPAAMRWSRALGSVLVTPAQPAYARTYLKRNRDPGAPPLIALMGTAALISLHGIVCGIIGLAALARLLWIYGHRSRPILLTIFACAACTLWGPYSTVLFSHGTSITCVSLCLLGLASHAMAPSTRAARLWAFVAGTSGAWAIASDFLLVVAIVPMIALKLSPRGWIWASLGAVLPGILVAAYHDAAFGHPLAIGYDHQTNFQFARARASTFGGDLTRGVATLFGYHRGAGLLAQSPLALLGLLILAASPGTSWRQSGAALLICWLPFITLLCLHQTPWGGHSHDYRYLAALLPLAGLGLATMFSRVQAMDYRRRAIAWPLIVVLALDSGYQTWQHFLERHEGSAWSSSGWGLACAVLVLVTVAGFEWAMRRHCADGSGHDSPRDQQTAHRHQSARERIG